MDASGAGEGGRGADGRRAPGPGTFWSRPLDVPVLGGQPLPGYLLFPPPPSAVWLRPQTGGPRALQQTSPAAPPLLPRLWAGHATDPGFLPPTPALRAAPPPGGCLARPWDAQTLCPGVVGCLTAQTLGWRGPPTGLARPLLASPGSQPGPGKARLASLREWGREGKSQNFISPLRKSQRL